MKGLVSFSLVVFFFSCTSIDSTSSESSFISKGAYDNKGFEVGPWETFSISDNRVIEEGSFIDGVRTGEWHYYSELPDTIKWLPFIDKHRRIRTNIPSFLKLSEENATLIRFRHLNSNELFNLIIGEGYTETISLESYKKMVYDDLSSRGVAISDSATNYIETANGKKYLFSFIYGSTEQQKENFILLNIASKTGKRIIEVSLRCDKHYDSKARKVFFSILPNLFINSVRFISSKEVITTLRGDVK